MSRRRTLPAAIILALAIAVPANAAAFPSRIELPAGWMPEGIAGGPAATLYVGSLAGGAIWRGSALTGDGGTLVSAVAGNVAVGIEYQTGAHRLWVAGGPAGAVRVYDAADGRLLESYSFSPATFLNDLVATRDAVYVTDSGRAWLNVIPLGADGSPADPAEAFMLPLTGIDVVAGQFNLNGIEAVRGWLVAVQSNTGLLFRIDPATGAATTIDTGGYSVSAGDGLYVQGNTLYVVRNQVRIVAVFRLSADVSSATLLGEITSSDLDVPATATVVAGRLWAVNARFGTPDPQPADYWISQLPARP